MIIDVNASLGHWPFRKLRHNTAEGMLSLMARVEIDVAWVAMLDCVFYRDVQDGNGDLRDSIRDFSQKLVPVAVINPNFPGWQEDIECCVRDWGMKIVRLYPNYHNYALGDPCFAELLDAAEKLGLVVCIAPRVADDRMHHWHVKVPGTDLSPLAGAISSRPELPIVLCNASVADLANLGSALAESPNVFVEISHIESVGGVAELAESIGVSRVLFGTHAPYLSAESAVLKMQEADLSDEDRACILGGNTKRLLESAGG